MSKISICNECPWYRDGCPDVLLSFYDLSCPYADKEDCDSCEYLVSCSKCRRGICCECVKEQFDLCMACRDR